MRDKELEPGLIEFYQFLGYYLNQKYHKNRDMHHGTSSVVKT